MPGEKGQQQQQQQQIDLDAHSGTRQDKLDTELNPKP